jgi:hypothetical protein
VNLALPRIGEELSSDLFGTLEAQSYVANGYFVTLSALLILAGALPDTSLSRGLLAALSARPARVPPRPATRGGIVTPRTRHREPIVVSLDPWTPALQGGGVAPARTPLVTEEGPMAKILYATSFGSDDPTRATIPFIAATGAIEAGHQPEIALLGEATYLVKTGMAEQIQGVGFPPLKQLFSRLIEHRVPIYV